MRSAPLLVAVIVLAGCAEGPDASSPSLPTPAAPTPTPAEPSTIWTESNDSWTYTVEAPEIDGLPGDALAFRAEVVGPEGASGLRFRLSTPWADPSRASVAIENGRASIEGVVYLGADGTLAATIQGGNTFLGFRGPTLPNGSAERSVPFERSSEVTDDAPWLSARVVGRSVVVTFAARENATSSADEAVSADSQLSLVRTPTGTRLVAFVTRASNDAPMMFDEPQRSRLVARIDDVPPGAVDVRIVSSVSCFCYELPSAMLHRASLVVE